MANFFETPIEFIKGVGPARAELLNKELGIIVYQDLLQYFPFRYEDRTKFYKINELRDGMPLVQVTGRLTSVEVIGQKYKQRLVAHLTDDTGTLELVWFKGASWVHKQLKRNIDYVIFGKPNLYGRKLNMAHPDIEVATVAHAEAKYLQPVYNTTELLKRKYVESKVIIKIVRALLKLAVPRIVDSLPENLKTELRLMSADMAYQYIHFPEDSKKLDLARFRLKFEELFYIQLQLLKLKDGRQAKFHGTIFKDTELLTQF